MKETKTKFPYGHFVDIKKEESKKRLEQMRKKMLSELDQTLSDLYREVKFEEAIVFGSITRRYCFKRNSDIDVAFRGLSDEDFFQTMAYLSERMKRNVDIIQLEKPCRFKEKIVDSGIKWSEPKKSTETSRQFSKPQTFSFNPEP